MWIIHYISYSFLIIACYSSFNSEVEIRPESDLTSSCYSFPEKDYGKSNNIRTVHGKSPYIVIQSGEQAIDFTLRTIPFTDSTTSSSYPQSIMNNNNNIINLRKLLFLKPVILIWGHGTCPAFRGYKNDSKFIGSSYIDEQQLINDIKDSVTVIHMISSEPHPIWPYTNFDSGLIKMNYWSIIKQPQLLDERMAWSASQVIPLLHPKAILAIDDLDGSSNSIQKTDSIITTSATPNRITATSTGATSASTTTTGATTARSSGSSSSTIIRNNPVWCSYANGARSAILIDMSGKIIYTQEWFNRESLWEAVQSMLMPLQSSSFG